MGQGAGLPVVWVIIFKPAYINKPANAGGISGTTVIFIDTGHTFWLADTD